MKEPRLNKLIMILATLLVMVSPALALVSQGAPRPGDVALIIRSPWSDPIDTIIANSGMQTIVPVEAPIGTLVVLGSVHSVTQLYENGAWLVVNGERILEICRT